MEFGDGRHSSQPQLSNYFPAQNRNHEEKLRQAVMELFSETYHSKSSSSASFESAHKEKVKMTIENRLSSLFPTIFDNPPNHPSYAVMVMAAIRSLNEKRGSKEESISKYIKEKYKNLPWAHPAILEDHLEKLVETGEILCVQKSRYRLPKGIDPEPHTSPKIEMQPKHKRGRELDQQVVRSLCEDDGNLIVNPKSKRTRVIEVECLQKQMPGRCLRPEQAVQQKAVEKSCFNEYGLIVHENDPLKLTIKLGLKKNVLGKERPHKKGNTEQVEQQKPVGETESNQQPADGMQVETETKEGWSDQSTVLGIIVENETRHNGLAGIEQLKEQPPVEESDMNVDLSNHHSMGMEVENQIDKGGSNHHGTVGTEVECEPNDDSSKQHLMVEQEPQPPVDKIDNNEDGSVVIEHVEQPQPVVEGSDINKVGPIQHPTGGVGAGIEANKDEILHVTVDTAVESETNADGLRQHLIDGIEQEEQAPPVEKNDTNEDGSVWFEQVEEHQPVEESGGSQNGPNQQLTLGIEQTEAKDGGLKHYQLVVIEVESETAMGSMPHRRTPAEKQDSKEVELQINVDEDKSNEGGMNQHQTSGIEVTPLEQVKSGGRSPEKNKLRMQPEVVIDAIELTDDIDGLMVSYLPKVVMEDEVEPAEVTKEEEPKTVRQTRGRAHKKCAPEQKQAMGYAIEPGDGNGTKVEVAMIEEVEPMVMTNGEEPDAVPIEMEPIPVRQTRGSARESCTSEQQQAMSDAVEPKDGNAAKVEVAVTKEVEREAVPKMEPIPVRQTRGSACKMYISEQQAMSDAVEQKDGNAAKVEVAVTKEVEREAVPKEMEPIPVRQTRGSARKRCTSAQQQAMSGAVEPKDGNAAKVEAVVTKDVEQEAVPKETEPMPIRQTRGSARKRFTLEKQQAMRDAVEPGDDSGSKVEVAVKEEVEPTSVAKEDEPNPVRQTIGNARTKCTPEVQQTMSDATDLAADNVPTIEVAVKEEEGKLQLQRSAQGIRLPKKHVCGPHQEDEIIVVVEEEEQKLHGRGGKRRGIGREETIVAAATAEKVHKPYVRRGRQRGRGQEETLVEALVEGKQSCGQGRKQRGRCPEKIVVE